ncbi:MAG: hypothetical protein Q8K42_00970 [Methylobacter sp.]|nr:hypothetical protein [Methylobacter sp.]
MRQSGIPIWSLGISVIRSLVEIKLLNRSQQDVGRNKSARRQQGRMFPAIGAPETPVLRLTRGQAYSGLPRDVYN